MALGVEFINIGIFHNFSTRLVTVFIIDGTNKAVENIISDVYDKVVVHTYVEVYQ